MQSQVPRGSEIETHLKRNCQNFISVNICIYEMFTVMGCAAKNYY